MAFQKQSTKSHEQADELPHGSNKVCLLPLSLANNVCLWYFRRAFKQIGSRKKQVFRYVIHGMNTRISKWLLDVMLRMQSCGEHRMSHLTNNGFINKYSDVKCDSSCLRQRLEINQKKNLH